jgi:prepilin-type N-terminal cleavage/methylation domain-containing protein
MHKTKREAGMSLLELLVVVAIIGIIASIAIVNYRGAVTKARQKRTVADIRNIATAWEARASEAHTYLAAGFTFPSDTVDSADLKAALVPTFAREFNPTDGWGRALQFGATAGASSGDEGTYAIRSAGRDGLYESTYSGDRVTRDPDCDIVFSDGQFVKYPDVAQSN